MNIRNHSTYKFNKSFQSFLLHITFLRRKRLFALLVFLLFITIGISLIHNQLTTSTKLSYYLIPYLAHADLFIPTEFFLSRDIYYLYSEPSLSNQFITYSIANPQMVLPPDVKMNYNGTEYDGKLISYKFRKTESFGQLDPLTKELSFRDVQNGELRDFTIKPNNIIKNLNFSLSESIKIENSSQVKFVITDSPYTTASR